MDKNFIKKIFPETYFSKNNTIEYCSVFKSPALKPKKVNQLDKFSRTEIFNVPRNSLSLFGFPAYGVHCNGWDFKDKTYHMILSKRSDFVRSFPGLYDNLVGGGQPNNLSFFKNILKESFEEAGLKKGNIKTSYFTGIRSYFPVFKKEFRPSVIAIYDIRVRNMKILQNNDGEISEFKKFKIAEIISLLENNLLKPNSVIPITDFLIRKNKTFFCETTLKEIIKYLK